MRSRQIFIALSLLILAAACCHAARGRAPYAGYVYPAGAQQGGSIRVTIGGQNLSNCKGAYFSGDGISAKVVEYIRPLSKKDMGDIGPHLRVLMRQRWAEALNPAATPSAEKVASERAKLEPLPNHAWVRDIDKMTLEQLEALRDKLFNPKLQPNSQIAELQVLDITVAAGAKAGDRELRLRTNAGMTNPIRFQVGRLPEVSERDPKPKTQTPAIALPVVLNGQIMPGEVDSFRLKAQRGQKLVITAQARRLTPYLADAVPGWFQATLTLLDASGKEVACADDYRSDPDPVLFFEVPADGIYTLEVNDSIYRGREDFVYRITAGEQPFITSIFPLGGAAGTATTATVTGWNLPFKQVTLNTQAGGELIRQGSWPAGTGDTNPIGYAVDSLPECLEVEPNETGKQAQLVVMPQTINGRIAKPGDVDVFRFEGRAGDTVVAEVCARRLGSPADALIRLIDPTGKVVASNDDSSDKASGLIADQADPYLSHRLAVGGIYYLQLSDAQRHGGEEYGYRLRLSPPRPDFALRLVPSTVDIPPLRIAPVTVHAIRRDGFSGEITIALKDGPTGCILTGARIPAGRDQVRFTLSLPGERLDNPVPLALEGSAQIAGAAVTRPVAPAEDMMQAFAYQHLVPMQQLVACGTGFGRFMPNLSLATAGPVRLPVGGSSTITIQFARQLPPNMPIKLQLSDPPKGFSLIDQKVEPMQITLVVKAEGMEIGYVDNLIVEVFTDMEMKRPGGKGGGNQRVSVGVLPAIPFEITKP